MVDSIAEVDDRAALTRFLEKRSNGHPLVVTETINYLCDFGHMTAGSGNRFRLRCDPGKIAESVPRRVDALVRKRVERLPESTRRLLSLAALIGHRFEFHLLRQAADEHALVVETAIGLMLSHWLGRQFPDAWASTHLERDIVLWAQGARRGTFEFAHKEIRRTLYRSIPEERRVLLHRRTAEAIQRTCGDALDDCCEELAYHFLRARAWEEAVVYLRLAAERAARLGADESAHSYCVDARETIVRLEASATRKSDLARWRRLGREVERLRQEIGERLGPEALSRYPSLSITMD